jgi:hypothetical protein
VHASVVGMWLAGLPAVMPVVKATVELWQLEQSPVVGCAESCTAVGRVTIVTPAKLLPASWQVAQPVVMPAWFIAVPAKLVNLVGAWQVSHAAVVGMWVAGGVTIVTPAKLLPVAWQVAQPLVIPAWFIAHKEKLVKLLVVWQLSQAAVVGMCVAGGVTTVMPKKVLPVAWQVAQPLVIPAWFIAVPAKLVKVLAE